jgi:ribonuclease P protein component
MAAKTFRSSERLGRKSTVERIFAEGRTLRPRSVPEPEQLLRIRFLAGTFAQIHGDFPEINLTGKPTIARLQVLFSVPKRRFKRAHDRNCIRRQLREAYRVHRTEAIDFAASADVYVVLVVLVQSQVHAATDVWSAQLAECLGSLVHSLRKQYPPATAPE